VADESVSHGASIAVNSHKSRRSRPHGTNTKKKAPPTTKKAASRPDESRVSLFIDCNPIEGIEESKSIEVVSSLFGKQLKDQDMRATKAVLRSNNNTM
jgi:hypothetical protein